MRWIAHRGNTHGVKKDRENHPDYIMDACKMDFECEVDVWFQDGTWYLGHDEPQHGVSLDFLYNPMLWLHCKNVDALVRLAHMRNMNTFWHQEDHYTLTSHGWVWCYPGKTVPLSFKTICVMPEIYNTDWTQFGGICSDYVGLHRDQAGTL